ncbi:MAG TPA: DUF6093 family protein [Nocardioidaceae bacterium]|nr:DUF6093 family protein [Nocardioidaceae bacterium]
MQARAESLMVDEFDAFEPGARGVDATDGMEKPGYTPQGSTVGKIQSHAREGDTQNRYVQVGETERPVLEAALHIPITATVPTPGLFGVGWEYECTASVEAANVGRRFLVVEVPSKTFATARRLSVVEL